MFKRQLIAKIAVPMIEGSRLGTTNKHVNQVQELVQHQYKHKNNLLLCYWCLCHRI